jgi:hypothetical protein
MAFRKFGSRALILIAMASLTLIITTTGLLTQTQTFQGAGVISISAVGVTIYGDAGLTTPISNITWGTLNPGGQTTTTIYIKNNGTIPETLTFAANTWTPSNANTYLTCTWNPTQTTLAANATTSAIITLAASSSAPATAFSFNMAITGTQ